MDTRNLSRWACAGCALGALFAGACTGSGNVSTLTTYGRGYSPAVTSGRRWQDPEFFGARVAERLGRIERRVRDDIAAGLLPDEALQQFLAARAHVERFVSQAALDGVIDVGERQAVRDLVRTAGTLTPSPVTARGGGPVETSVTPTEGYARPVPRSYFDESWEWGIGP
jgi:hypothetical protein